MKIMFAMATYNRKETLETCIGSLSKIDNLNEIDLFVFDDCSSDYDYDFLQEKISFAKKIVRRDMNLKADKNIYNMYLDFLNSEYDYLFETDSDMLFNKDIIYLLKQVISSMKSNQVISFYNSNNHDVSNERPIYINGIKFLSKKDIGSAGVLFSRLAIEKIVKNVDISNGFSGYDYKWSEYLLNNGFSIYVSENSYLQHIGFIGQNNDGIKGLDIGYNFTPTNNEDKDFLFRQYENIISNYTRFVQENIFIKRNKIPNFIWKFWSFIKSRKAK